MNRFTRLAAAGLLGAACGAAAMHWQGSSARAESTFSIPSPTGKFVTRAVVVGTTWVCARLDSTTGDCSYDSGGKWAKYVDPTPPGAGCYDIQLIAMPDGKTYNLVRTDLISGRVWMVAGTQWTLVTEQ